VLVGAPLLLPPLLRGQGLRRVLLQGLHAAWEQLGCAPLLAPNVANVSLSVAQVAHEGARVRQAAAEAGGFAAGGLLKRH
jgi:hypothetical protein